jgi:hypothetical protein
MEYLFEENGKNGESYEKSQEIISTLARDLKEDL